MPETARFSILAQLAADLAGTPIAQVCYLDADGDWLCSTIGAPHRLGSPDHPLWVEAMSRPGPLVIDDVGAAAVPVEPFPVGGPHVVAFVGLPVPGPDGRAIGLLVVADTRPRSFDDATLAHLGQLARLTGSTLADRQQAESVERELDVLERFRVLADAVADVLMAFDTHGTIIFANHAATMLFEAPEGEPLLGRKVQSLVVTPTSEETTALLGRAAEGFRQAPLEVVMRSADGQLVTLDVAFRLVRLDGEIVFTASGRDLTAQRAAERDIRRLRHEMELVLTNAAEGIVRVDQDGVVMYANGAATHLLGFDDASELIGNSVHVVCYHQGEADPPVSEAECHLLAAIVEGRMLADTRDVFRTRTDAPLPVAYTASPIYEDGELLGAAIVFADISERFAVEQAKDEFLAIVSHEMRTPLTSLKGALGLVAAGVFGPLPDKAAEMLGVAVASSDRLVRLVNDILDLQRIEEGRLTLDLATHHLDEIVHTAVQEVRALATSASITLVEDVTDGELRCDFDRIVQVLTNLLGNAVKFSPDGASVTVRATVDGPVATLQVIDAGRGIPAADLQRIFGRFEQVDVSDARRGSGSGLGLAIVRGFVDQHGGTVTATSELGVGTTFTVTLPVAGPGKGTS